MDHSEDKIDAGDVSSVQSRLALHRRIATLEARMDATELFFVQMDETLHRYILESKKRRRRFLGIF